MTTVRELPELLRDTAAATTSTITTPNLAIPLMNRPASATSTSDRHHRTAIDPDTLPIELKLQVASLLPLKALIALRRTSRYWRRFVDAVKHDALTIHPSRAALLDLWEEWASSEAFRKSRDAVTARLMDWGEEGEEERERYLERLPAGGEGEGAAEFAMWVREWPAKAVVGCVWPGLRTEEEEEVRRGQGIGAEWRSERLPPLPDWYHSGATNLLPPATFKHAHAWPLQLNGDCNNWVHCRLDFEHANGWLVGGGCSEQAAAGWNPSLLSRNAVNGSFSAWATGIKIQYGPVDGMAGSGSGQVVLLLSGAGPLNGTVQAKVEDIMTHQGSDYVAVRIPKGGRNEGVTAGSWTRWLREQTTRIEREYEISKKH